MQSPKLGAKLRNKRPEALKPIKERGYSSLSDVSAADGGVSNASVSDLYEHVEYARDDSAPLVACGPHMCHDVPYTELPSGMAAERIIEDQFTGQHRLLFYAPSLYAKHTVLPWSATKVPTAAVVLLTCLNIGTDPPDGIKVSPYPILECWKDPRHCGEKKKGCEMIVSCLRAQYVDMIGTKSHVKYYVHPDVTKDEVGNMIQVRKQINPGHRVVVHYNGHGVPAPSKQGEIWVFNPEYTQYMPIKGSDLLDWVSCPACIVLDVRRAGLVANQIRATAESCNADVTVLTACGAREDLPSNSYFPADVFSSSLTTPVKMAVLWHCYNNQMPHAHAMGILHNLDKAPTLAASLLNVLSTIIDSIAWDVLPTPVFLRLFKQDPMLTSLFRNFVLAQRVMMSLSVTPQSYPPLPVCTTHARWDEWDWHLDQFLMKVMLTSLFRNFVLAQRVMMSLSVTPQSYPPLPVCTTHARWDEWDWHLDQFLMKVMQHKHGVDAGQALMHSFFKNQQVSFLHSLANHHNDVSLVLPIVIPSLCLTQCQCAALSLLAGYADGGTTHVNNLLAAGLLSYLIRFCKVPPPQEAHCHLLYLWVKVLAFDETVSSETSQCMPFFLSYVKQLGNEATVEQHLSLCVVTIVCRSQSSARDKVCGVLFPKYKENLLCYGKQRGGGEAWSSPAGVLNWMLLLTSAIIEGESHQINEFVDRMGVSTSCEWLEVCAAHPSQCVRGTTMNVVRLLALRIVSQHYDELDMHLLTLLVSGCSDLSPYVRLYAARGLLCFVTSLHSARGNCSFHSASSGDENDEFTVKALSCAKALLSDSISTIAAIGERTVSLLKKPKEVVSTVTLSPMRGSNQYDKSGKGMPDLSMLEDELEDPSQDDVVQRPSRLSLVTPSYDFLNTEEQDKVSLLSCSIAHAARVTLDGDDVSSTRSEAKRCIRQYNASFTAACMDYKLPKPSKMSLHADADAALPQVKQLALHPTLCLALYGNRDTVNVWNWKLGKTATALRVRNNLGPISSLDVMDRFDVSPIVTATSKGHVLITVDWFSNKSNTISGFHLVPNPAHDCIARAAYGSRLWCSGAAGQIKVADIEQEREMASIASSQLAALTAMEPCEEGAVGVVGHASGGVYTVDERVQGVSELGKHQACVVGVVRGSEEHTACSVSSEGLLCVWDVRRPMTAVMTHEMCKKEGKVLNSISLHRKFPLAMTCSASSARMHHLPSRTHVSTTERDGLFKGRAAVTACVFHPNAPLAFSCAGSRLALLAFS
eukprot:TRINITY_DN3080_c0_g1_i1.p1 TRINITY_DN3080_c0_g1~~TRINITY_DN3080_c0_g1_i1.p1  ORF type:complete len:1259 (+),score=323.65 TRINITY_DN3080_c0_g1_i1:592-4368(+)